MQVVVLGTVAFDSIQTPHGRKEYILGGSATYFSLACRLFASCGIVAVVGEDFTEKYLTELESFGVDIKGLEITKGKTFHWDGLYEGDMNQAQTQKTELNVLENFKPQIPKSYVGCEYLFLGNTDPEIQIETLKKTKPKHSICDTMDYWIKSNRQTLSEVFHSVDMIVLNEGEAKQYCKTSNLIAAGKILLEQGIKRVIIKKGEHGAILFTEEGIFCTPAYPLDYIVDPTGAGDSFGGGLTGYLANKNTLEQSELKKAIVTGTVVASFTVGDFGIDCLKDASKESIESRYKKMQSYVRF
ncbi:MAG: PfkB family carbohydrate kinase [Candidatus Altiarchaeota archaeon]